MLIQSVNIYEDEQMVSKCFNIKFKFSGKWILWFELNEQKIIRIIVDDANMS